LIKFGWLTKKRLQATEIKFGWDTKKRLQATEIVGNNNGCNQRCNIDRNRSRNKHIQITFSAQTWNLWLLIEARLKVLFLKLLKVFYQVLNLIKTVKG
jgi:hypothetical protein